MVHYLDTWVERFLEAENNTLHSLKTNVTEYSISGSSESLKKDVRLARLDHNIQSPFQSHKSIIIWKAKIFLSNFLLIPWTFSPFPAKLSMT